MPEGHIYYTCPNCQKQYDLYSLLGLMDNNHRGQYTDEGGYQFTGKCKCGVKAIFVIEPEYLDDVFDAMRNEELRAMPEPEPDDEFGWPEEEYYDLPTEPQGSTDNLQQVPKTDTQSKIEVFKLAIKSIDKNLDEPGRAQFIRDALQIIVGEPQSDIQACFGLLKKEFKYTERYIEAFRKDMTSFQKQQEIEKKRDRYNTLMDQLRVKPKELSDTEKTEALAYLKNPKLIENISNDIATAGEVIGEETNKMMLYLAAVSRKFTKPISLVIFGKSSSGKSFLANAIAEFIPPEDRLILSSTSARAFEYMGEYLKHKFVLVQEWEGIENILPTIRTLQSEGRLSRLVTIKNPDDNTHKAIANSYDCPCTVIITTTREGIHDENSTRIFELQADDSIAQTKSVVQKNILNASLKYSKADEGKRQIFELHQNMQRLLEPVEVDIPFADHLTFPAKTTRNRRDSERFMQLIKAVAFLRQKQKPMKNIEGVTYVEADLNDYQTAYNVGLEVISSTLGQISDRSKNVLKVCCEITDDRRKTGENIWFTVSQIQEKAPSLGMDFSNRQDLYKQLRSLTEYEYLAMDQPKPKGIKFYSVIFNYVRDQFGNLINIQTPEIKEITTPQQLAEKLQTI